MAPLCCVRGEPPFVENPMFINTSIGYLNTDAIKSYKNRWKRKPAVEGQKYPGYEANGCQVDFLDGTTSILETHIDIPSPEMPIIIQAFPGSIVIQRCEDEGGEIYFSDHPVIAWKIDEDSVAPITPESSWGDTCNDGAVVMKDDPRVFTYNCVFETRESYENHVKAQKR